MARTGRSEAERRSVRSQAAAAEKSYWRSSSDGGRSTHRQRYLRKRSAIHPTAVGPSACCSRAELFHTVGRRIGPQLPCEFTFAARKSFLCTIFYERRRSVRRRRRPRRATGAVHPTAVGPSAGSGAWRKLLAQFTRRRSVHPQAAVPEENYPNGRAHPQITVPKGRRRPLAPFPRRFLQGVRRVAE